MGDQKFLAMYDVRGIQSYIYKTNKVQDAIGASAIIENIILEALTDAVKNENVLADLCWFDENGALPYKDTDKQVELLYVGGGNALVSFSGKEICIAINKRMSKYILEKTYSLQLAVAVSERSDNYSKDYEKLFEELVNVKAKMEPAQPLGALPIMDVEIKSGLPKFYNKQGEKFTDESMETFHKKQKEAQVRKDIINAAKLFDSYIENKGEDSTIAVVHIDGNNMGLRIRELISGIADYSTAITTMRQISYRIDNSYKAAFDEMSQKFNPGKGDNKSYNVLRILTAGDDITYICKGKYALETVDCFCKLISAKTMNGQYDKDSIIRYGFSVCAGIAYIGSHFPFYIGYDVAEKCCDSAKDAAKKAENKLTITLNDVNYEKVGNWLDFQVCKNVQTSDLDATREREYVTRSGENLLIRPYELPLLNLENRKSAVDRYEVLRDNILTFKGLGDNSKNIPRSHVKEIRNRYSMGKHAIKEFVSFLESRGYVMPDGTRDMYTSDNKALWYDAIELLDCFDILEGENGHE